MLLTKNGQAAERVFHYHFRRAGGTSLSFYCRHLAAANGLDYEVVEGHSLDHERYFATPPPTLHMTCLRDPIARIKSSYRFEGRWLQMERDPRLETAKPFSTWVAETRCVDGRSFLWKCTENYYVKALIGYPRIGADGVGRAELDLAKRRLHEFELVFVTDWLSRPEVAAYLRRQLGFDMPVPHRRYPELERPAATDEELFDEPTLARLEETNQLDFELFQEAGELLRQRIRACDTAAK